ncbi:MAG TPA: hypothetical protein VFI96_00305, partial [Longimicrobiaceae bacterium]|nr:hypothetical protein [Longimicrobiaceae bacterium]
YRESFTPSEQFPRPHVLMAVTVLCAETDEEAERLASSMALNWLRIRRGEFSPIPSPEEALAHPYTPQEQAGVKHYLEQHFIGSPATVRQKLDALVEETGADELMASTMTYDPAARLRSYELLADAFAPRAG